MFEKFPPTPIQSYPPSGLTEDECLQMLPFLNARYNLYPGEFAGCTQWVAAMTFSQERRFTKMQDRSWVVKLDGLCSRDIEGLSGDTYGKITLDELMKRIGKVVELFQKDAIIKGKFSYNDDNGTWYITDVSVLAQLKEKAFAYNAAMESKSAEALSESTLDSECKRPGFTCRIL